MPCVRITFEGKIIGGNVSYYTNIIALNKVILLPIKTDTKISNTNKVVENVVDSFERLW